MLNLRMCLSSFKLPSLLQRSHDILILIIMLSIIPLIINILILILAPFYFRICHRRLLSLKLNNLATAIFMILLTLDLAFEKGLRLNFYFIILNLI